MKTKTKESPVLGLLRHEGGAGAAAEGCDDLRRDVSGEIALLRAQPMQRLIAAAIAARGEENKQP